MAARPRPIATVLRFRYEGGFGKVEHPAAIAQYGRIEGFVQLGSVKYLRSATFLAQVILDTLAHPRTTLVAEIESRLPSDLAYWGFNVGDTVKAHDGDSLTDQRVMSITVTEDGEGNPVAIPELGDLAIVQEERIERITQTILAGGLGGMSSAVANVARTDSKFEVGEIRSGDSPEFTISGEVAIGNNESAPHQFTEPTRIIGWGIVSETFGFGTTKIEFRKNGNLHHPLDFLQIGPLQKVALAYIYGQNRIWFPGQTLSINVVLPGAHEDITVRFVGVPAV